jgi:hypothetical protein
MNATLREAEISALATVLRSIVVRDRTGEIGIAHGAGRFVSTNVCLKKAEREALDSAVRKVGLTAGVTVVDK